MGVFTSIIHPVDGRELQIKSWMDDCETYHVGDVVNWHVFMKLAGAGKLLDDVYDSYSDRGVDDWVIIKYHKVMAVEPRSNPNDSVDDRTLLRQKYKITDPPREWWSAEVWAEHQHICEENEKEFVEQNKRLKHLPPIGRIEAMLSEAIGKQLDYQGIVRQIFSVNPLTTEDKAKG